MKNPHVSVHRGHTLDLQTNDADSTVKLTFRKQICLTAWQLKLVSGRRKIQCS